MRYCCRDCQRADWADHKHECAALRAVTSAGENARADTLDADLLMARVRLPDVTLALAICACRVVVDGACGLCVSADLAPPNVA